MDEHGARRLVARIEHEPGWRAEASVGRDGAWSVKARQAGETRAEATTFTSVYGFHYYRLKLSADVRSLKSMRLALLRRKGA